MEERRTAYIYGSTARALEAGQPLRRREEEIRRKEIQRQRQRKQPRKKLDKVAVLLTCITFAAVMIIGIFYLHLQFQSTYLSKNVVRLQSEVVNMEKENAAAKMKLEETMSLPEIYKKATEELGMKMAGKNQVYTYKSRKSTQVRQHGSVPTD